jgi:hypothetical protein
MSIDIGNLIKIKKIAIEKIFVVFNKLFNKNIEY